MPPLLRVCISEASDPFLNLAIENHLFRAIQPGMRTLLLWRNDPSVVIGRHQNPWVECDLPSMTRDGVHLVRRQSGGGAVYHDPGNGNFSFLASGELYDQDVHFAIVIDALARLGIEAERSPRNDILVDGRKISGNAFKHTRDRSFHHGTLLIDADLRRLTAYLAPREAGLVSKGIKSVRSRVANLTEFVPGLDFETLVSALAEAFARYHHESVPVERVGVDTRDAHPEVARYREELQSWDWRYGNTPEFTQRIDGSFDAETVSIECTVRHAVIEDLAVRIVPENWETRERAKRVETLLVGARYDGDEILQRAERSAAGASPDTDEVVREIIHWFAREAR